MYIQRDGAPHREAAPNINISLEVSVLRLLDLACNLALHHGSDKLYKKLFTRSEVLL